MCFSSELAQKWYEKENLMTIYLYISLIHWTPNTCFQKLPGSEELHHTWACLNVGAEVWVVGESGKEALTLALLRDLGKWEFPVVPWILGQVSCLFSGLTEEFIGTRIKTFSLACSHHMIPLGTCQSPRRSRLVHGVSPRCPRWRWRKRHGAQLLPLLLQALQHAPERLP